MQLRYKVYRSDRYILESTQAKTSSLNRDQEPYLSRKHPCSKLYPFYSISECKELELVYQVSACDSSQGQVKASQADLLIGFEPALRYESRIESKDVHCRTRTYRRSMSRLSELQVRYYQSSVQSRFSQAFLVFVRTRCLMDCFVGNVKHQRWHS